MEVFTPVAKHRTIEKFNSYNKKISKTSEIKDGMIGSIRARLIDYQALINLNLEDFYKAEQLSITREVPKFLHLKTSFEQPLYLNKNNLHISTLQGPEDSSIPITDTGWLATRQSILSTAKILSRTKNQGNVTQAVNFNENYYINQIYNNVQQHLLSNYRQE